MQFSQSVQCHSLARPLVQFCSIFDVAYIDIMPVNKYCVVPLCTNSSVKTPSKLFFQVPMDTKRRKKWTTVMKRADPIGPKTTSFCCEDHFDIENDMENYVKYKLVGGKLKLKKDACPHKFFCQKKTVEKPERSAVQKRKQQQLIHKILHEDIPDTNIQEIFLVTPAQESDATEPSDPLIFQEENENIIKERRTKNKKIQVCITNKTVNKGTMTDTKYFDMLARNTKPKREVRKKKK